VIFEGIDGAALLGLLQLADSFFPSGTYAHSYGLETAVAEGKVASATDVERFVRAQLVHQVAGTDAVALQACARALAGDRSPDWETVLAVDRRLTALKLAREGREASAATGRRLAIEAAGFLDHRLTAHYRALVESGAAPANHAVAWAVAGAAIAIPRDTLAIGYLYSFATNLLGAALRLLPYSHVQAQTTLHALKPLLTSLALEAGTRDWREMAGFAPGLELVAMRHERAEVRLFRS
jgi:urease accessory protein